MNSPNLASDNAFSGRDLPPRAPSPSRKSMKTRAGTDSAQVGSTDDNNAIISRGPDQGAKLAGGVVYAQDKRRFHYDTQAGKSKTLEIGLSRDDRMSAEEAGNMLRLIHTHCGVMGLEEHTLDAFDRALWVCHTVNGGSILNPGRCIFEVPGATNAMDYTMIVHLLGNDLRRFFRAYADEITRANKLALKGFDPSNPVSSEIWGWINQVAYERGLQRYPYLAHDSADACTFLTTAERAALDAAKYQYLIDRPNAVDASLRQRRGDKGAGTPGSLA